MFRLLREDEIDVRVATINQKGATLLLYKDARCDMNILDETVGSFNWKRQHTRDNANCIVSLWDENKKEWISNMELSNDLHFKINCQKRLFFSKKVLTFSFCCVILHLAGVSEMLV